MSIIESSVRKVGILPSLSWRNNKHGGVDISALGGNSNQIMPMEMPVIMDYLSDEIRVMVKQNCINPITVQLLKHKK